jgi:hypothetical protein
MGGLVVRCELSGLDRYRQNIGSRCRTRPVTLVRRLQWVIHRLVSRMILVYHRSFPLNYAAAINTFLSSSLLPKSPFPLPPEGNWPPQGSAVALRFPLSLPLNPAPDGLIHRSAWNKNSRKFGCKILHIPGPIPLESPLQAPRSAPPRCSL